MDRDTARGQAYVYARTNMTDSKAKRPKRGERFLVRYPPAAGELVMGDTPAEVIENLASKIQEENLEKARNRVTRH